VLISFTVLAKEVPRDVAVNAATFYFKERCNVMGKSLATEPTIKSVYAEKDGNNTLYYIVNFEQIGFVVIAANDASVPVLGYSIDQNLDKNNSSPALKDWFTIYEESLKAVYKTNAKPTAEAKAEWLRITDTNAVVRNAKVGTPVVAPLLTSVWNQDQYYNEQVPFDSMSVSGYDFHVPNGCVALSTSQVMYYNRYPQTGTNSRSYTENDYGYLSANFGATNYNFDAFTDELSNYNFNIAKLISHVGISVWMDYAVDGSGSQTTYAAQSLKQFFGYSSNVTFKNKSNYTDVSWKAMYKQQLDARHPMVNSGSGTGGGHAFNCDGYDDQDYFHFNWGWGASGGNGYYLLTNLNPNGSDFNSNQGAIINIYPQTAPAACPANVVLTARNGSLEDGSRSADYGSNLDCQWVIAPEDATAITISFSRIATEAGVDSVVFYNGETTASPVVASFSGSTIPADFTVNGPKTLVRFITNGTVQNDGWLINYSATVPANYCNSIKVYSTATGTVTDGSATSKYRNNSYCKFYIQPVGASNVTLTFTEFDLSADDQLYVLNRSNMTNPSLMKVLNGNTLPAAIYCPSGKLGLVFQADNLNTAGGFSANWSTNTDGVNEISGVEGISLYPNPTTSLLNIEMALENKFEGSISIIDVSGRLVYSSDVNASAGVFNHSVDVSNLSSGFYLINFVDNQGQRISMKFSKQ